MNNEVENEGANIALQNFYNTATNDIQTSALINRALTDKISTETINQKVNNQLSSIYTQMNRINPNFNETSKKYGIIKKDILDVLTDYEFALTEYSDYYDVKLENLILKKVELESNLVGKVFKTEDLNRNSIKMRFKEKSKMDFSEKTKSIIEKVSIGKKNNSVDCADIIALKDLNDLNEEQKKKVYKLKEINKNDISNIEKEIRNVSKQISELNEEKRLKIEEAMESREKWIAVNLRKPSLWSRTRKFFASRFYAEKVISKEVINPLRIRVKEFRTNEIEKLKG